MNKKPPVKKPVPVTKPVKAINENAFAGWEQYLAKNQLRLLLILPLITGAIFAMLTFDLKISEGNDDAMYIEAATKYAADFTGYYYTSNAPMYPMVLGIVTMVTGFNLTLYKFLNTIFFLVHLALMFFAFRRRVPYTVLFPVLLLSSVNSYFLYYASQTYTEMLFLSLQALFFLVFYRWQENQLSANTITANSAYNTILPPAPGSIKSLNPIKNALMIGLVLFLMTFCKNIAIGTLGAVILFFTIQRNWRSLAEAVLGYLVIRFTFEGIKAAVWGSSNQYGSQGAILLQKDAYNPAAGREDINGFVTRFFENFDLYTSKRLFQVLGFKDPDSTQTHTILSLLVVVLLAFTLWRIFKEFNKVGNAAKTKKANANSSVDNITAASSRDFYNFRMPQNVFFVVLYVITMVSLTYLVLQTRWDQPRLIMVYVPLLVMVVLYGFYSWFYTTGLAGRVGYVAIVVLVAGSSFLSTIKKSVANYPVLKKNLKGDIYYGYTPDWENFLRLSAYCADSLPEGSYVASRKAPMSFVYAKGMPFYPVYTVPAIDTVTNLSNPDTVLAMFKENKVTHVLLGSLRRNPKKPDGYIINTLHRMLQPIATKYPQKIKLVKQIGETEPAYLYEIVD